MVPSCVAVPCGGSVTLTTLSVSPSGSVSLSSTAMSTGVSSAVVAKSFSAWGPSLTHSTTSVTVATASAWPSVTMYVNPSAPQ